MFTSGYQTSNVGERQTFGPVENRSINAVRSVSTYHGYEGAAKIRVQFVDPFRLPNMWLSAV